MSSLYRWARKIKNSSPALQHAYAQFVNFRRKYAPRSYATKFEEEQRTYADVDDVNQLPSIFGYWSNKYLVPMLAEFGVSNPDEFFAKYLYEAAEGCGREHSAFVSIGAGNCDTEVRVARLLGERGLKDFTIECCDLNPQMLARGKIFAKSQGVENNLTFVECDLNSWTASRSYAGVIANQSLHHIVNLEGLFDEIKRSLLPRGQFVISDIIGRNGHQRWPEALREVRRFWKELPKEYRYNLQLRRQELIYENWDCSTEGFEGVRAQDILPLLLQRFNFYAFL